VLSTPRQRGFNLIEAIVTIAIVGVLLAATMPSMAHWIRATHVRNLAETTQSGLQKARTEAMKSNKVVTFWLVSPANTARPDDSCALSSTSAAWVVSLDDPAGKCSQSPSTTAEPRLVQSYGPGTAADGMVVKAVDSAAADATSVSFNGFGQRVGAGIANIDISHTMDGVRALRIEISPSGGIRSCDPAVTDATDPRICRILP
jgi:type IV fimbrial biogenesis protein FimT